MMMMVMPIALLPIVLERAKVAIGEEGDGKHARSMARGVDEDQLRRRHRLLPPTDHVAAVVTAAAAAVVDLMPPGPTNEEVLDQGGGEVEVALRRRVAHPTFRMYPLQINISMLWPPPLALVVVAMLGIANLSFTRNFNLT
mmetsp:Transcript_2353/g.3736  ORF Transcript_2353/g.3736 Transcript_2353/m.3736 type:complete len:141 (+) Transcript_2353:128-550(+)